ncbi:hypothetical protein [Novosphingobium beihaiensis]|uniref:Uncharacterized protein n=1 Tax=Novosphingobium beihaiensis TaxID=2930389 RepID=A0ABT0BVV1_9SPHN|nr:hypothetical protein [Novosphingobium beihaiensis]MCJ2189068.1 hypothetical protein [Novosphingobium beihaiensis]
MTIGNITSTARAFGVLGTGSQTAGQPGAVAARAVAFEAASRVGAEFGACGNRQPDAAYPLAELADRLGGALGATPLETVELEQALGELATAAATDMAALADGRTLERLDTALAQHGEGPADAAGTAQMLRTVASALASARP